MHDVLIIGAGPAGLSAARWCDDLGLDTLLLEQDREAGGQLLSIYGPIENYLGRRAENGRELRDHFLQQSENAGFDLWTNVEIESVELSKKRIALTSGEELNSIAIIIATGRQRRKLDVEGENEFQGRGMIESAERDRQLFAGKDVCVAGGGEHAVEDALQLAEVCSTVTLVHQGNKLRAHREYIQRLQTTHCVTLFAEASVQRIMGNNRVEAVEIRRAGAIKPFQMAVQGVLVRIGFAPNIGLVSDQLEFDERGYVIVNAQQETSVENVFAAGDVCTPLAPNISSAAGSGAMAANVIAARLSVKS
jgi:thioredoxin reductase (NADPH)